MTSGVDLRRAAPVVLVLAVGVWFSWHSWVAQPAWWPDAVYYEAQSHELTGADAHAERTKLFAGPLGHAIPGRDARLSDPEWIEWASRLYRRRWVVPALDAALRPVAGLRALEVVTLLGYLAAGLVTYLFVRLRARPWPAAAAACAVLWFPPLRETFATPGTDALGLATVGLCLLVATWALSGGRGRLAVWAGSVLLLAFTRDASVIALAAAAGAALVVRSRRSVELLAVGAAVAVPITLFTGAPIRDTIAFAFNGRTVPQDTSWSFILARWLPSFRTMMRVDFDLAHSLPLFAAGALVLACAFVHGGQLAALRRFVLLLALAAFAVIVFLGPAVFEAEGRRYPLQAGQLLLVALVPLVLDRRRDRVSGVLAGGLAGAGAYVLVQPQITDLRIALVLLPFAAVGVAQTIAAAQALRMEQAPGRASVAPDAL